MKILLIAGLVGLAQTQNADIITTQNQIAPPSDGGVIFNQDGENHVVEYRKDFNEDDCKYKGKPSKKLLDQISRFFEIQRSVIFEIFRRISSDW